mmetsp:Transcript_11528/g.14145  ORF Transcript_11528/g.14145 Transcript_11528/m.14145 type:complete len:88 (-) Transcript_11528:58-321(-)
MRFWQVLLSGGALKQNEMNVPGKTPKAIKRRLERLRTQPIIQDLLPFKCDAAIIRAQNPLLPDVINIAFNGAESAVILSIKFIIEWM